MNNLSPDEPRQIGRYSVRSRLGRGGMGTVYLGEDPTGQPVAIKVINPEYSRHEQFRMRFRREADAAMRVRRFCTAAVIEAALDGDQLYVVTEYVGGPNLEEAVARSGPLRGSSLDALAVGVATALTAIHGAGIVHRDLKPSNVLLSPVGPRVIDFGIARALDTLGGITGTGEIIGTPRYMAPEVLRGEPVSPACDVFSWGCLVAFAATGRPPFNGEALHAVLYQVLSTDPVLEGLEPGLRELVTYSLSKDPARRPTAQQLLDSMVGRSAVPEQTAYSVQNAWQRAAQPPAAPAHAPQGAPPAGHGAPQTPPGAPQTLPGGPQTLPGAPQTLPGGAPAVATGTPAVAGGPAPAFQATAPHAAGDTLRATAQHHAGPPPAYAPPATGDGPTRPGIGSRSPRVKVIAGAAVAALVAAALGVGAWALLRPSGPPEGLAVLYQDDFTSSGTGWGGGTYTDGTDGGTYGYSPEGYYAIDVTGENSVRREEAPIPYVPQQPATPDPSATPTPTTPERLLLGVDAAIREGTKGTGEFGLFAAAATSTRPRGTSSCSTPWATRGSGRWWRTGAATWPRRRSATSPPPSAGSRPSAAPARTAR
ncbi:serine/threonine-protein kinase [Thermocatellispora tengchongensis]|uniref:serine/threonine-protein kinase n=1 Tax=Thermocatellispora tengchongensis TaxID=1073253 RepID=UPI003628FDBB